MRLLFTIAMLACLFLAMPGRAGSNAPGSSIPGNLNLQQLHGPVLQTYLYIEPHEVRHEVLIQVSQLGAWMDLGLRRSGYIEPGELPLLKERVGAFLQGTNPVRIDGEAVKPDRTYISYVKHGQHDIQLLEMPGQLDASTASIGMISTYITAGIPQRVSVDWGLFTERVQRVPATATDPSGPLLTYLTPDDNVHTWVNSLKDGHAPAVQGVAVHSSIDEVRIPIGTLLCMLAMLPAGWQVHKRRQLRKTTIGPGVLVILLTSGALFSWAYSPTFVIDRPVFMAPDLDNAQSVRLLKTLLKNVYRALNYPVQRDVFDNLALTVDDDLLADVYSQHRRSFVIPKAAESQARVRAIEVTAATARRIEGQRPAYEIRGHWSALGSVEHWGYVHMRQNVYSARVTVEAVDDRWKITGLQLLDVKQVEPGAPAATATVH